MMLSHTAAAALFEVDLAKQAKDSPYCRLLAECKTRCAEADANLRDTLSRSGEERAAIRRATARCFATRAAALGRLGMYNASAALSAHALRVDPSCENARSNFETATRKLRDRSSAMAKLETTTRRLNEGDADAAVLRCKRQRIM